MASNRRIYRRNYRFRPLFHLLLAVLLCVLLPFLVQTWGLPMGYHEPEAQHTALAALAALVIGFWLNRNLGQLPGTRESAGILPSFTISFSLVLAAILLWRISYSRGILVLAFVLSNSWFFFVYMFTQRRARLALGVVPGGHVGLLEGMTGVDMQPLSLGTWPDGLDAVVADFRREHGPEWEARLTDFVLAGIPVYHSKDLYESLTGRAELEHLSENNFGALGPQTSLLVLKNLIDRTTAVPALILLAPVMLLTALAIRLDSRGPVLFRQPRIGLSGREFTIYKFRTMHVELVAADPDGAGVARYMTRRRDPRITRLGQFLRHSRLDELPQIINILRGEMSWIGPRPEAAALSIWYQEQIPFYRYRYVVRPGISGWAQVNQGHVAEVDDVRTKLQFDFYYIRNFSVWLDLLIIAKTIKTMLSGFGSR